MAVPTPAEIIAAIDQTVYDLTVLGASESSALGKVWRAVDLDKLMATRQRYVDIAAVDAQNARGGVLSSATAGIPARGR